jgi:predicted NBD/HSP70 family sugar kinase
MSNLWGIDLGGTKIEGVILKSKDDPEVLIRERIPTNSHKGYDHILNQIIILVDSISDKIGESP